MKVQLTICSNRGIDPRFVVQNLNVCLSKIPEIQLSCKIGMDGTIDWCRSLEATRFLETDQDYILFLDDDVLCHPEDISRLVQDSREKASVVAGAYRQKRTGDRMAIKLLDGEEVLPFGPNGTLREVKWVAAGFTCVPREILLEMSKGMELLNIGSGKEMYPFFIPSIHEGWYLPEDFAFSQRVRDLGYKIWVDTRIILGHIGTHIYTL